MRRIILLSIAGLISAAYVLFPKILMKPYLQAVSGNTIYVMVESDTKDTVTVRYLSSDNEEKQAKTAFIAETDNRPETYIHKVFLTGLKQGAVYIYYATQGRETTNKSQFTASVPSGVPFRFAVAGDFRSNPVIHSQIANKIRSEKPLFSIYTGDLCFGIKYSFWKDEFFTEGELKLASQIPFFNAVGNHEGWEKNTMAFTQAPLSKSGRQDYYSFDYGDVHFLILNTTTSLKPGTEQYKFAEADLQSTDKKWKIVATHHPGFCYGGHKGHKGIQVMSENLFKKYKVDIVFSGHSHYYQHNLVDGIHHIITGGGGAPLYTPDKGEYTIKSIKSHHYGIADVSPSQFILNIYSQQGELLDKIEIKK